MVQTEVSPLAPARGVPFARIAHPTDLTEDSTFAFQHALRLAAAAGAKLDILHVHEAPHVSHWDALPTVRETLAGWGLSPDLFGEKGDRVQQVTAYGREPVHPILSYIDESLPDLMVLATHRRSGVDRLLHKEIAQKLARSRAIDTLFVPFGDEGFVSPSNGTLSLRRILIAVDWLPSPQPAVDAVNALGRMLGCETLELTLLHVSERDRTFPAVVTAKRKGWTWTEKRRQGDVVEEVLGEADELGADLVVMTTQGHDGFLDALRGSTTDRVLRGVPCPLLAVASH